ncbi:hypothetical protein D3C80_2016800 [compost metagenome]
MYSIASDDFLGLLQLNTRQLGCTLIKCFCRNTNPWDNRPAKIISLSIDTIKRCRRSEIHHHQRTAILLNSGDCIYDPVCSNLTRIFVP